LGTYKITFKIEGNLKIVEIIINHKGTRMVKDEEE